VKISFHSLVQLQQSRVTNSWAKCPSISTNREKSMKHFSSSHWLVNTEKWDVFIKIYESDLIIHDRCNSAISYLNRLWISIYSYLPAHGGDSPTTAPMTNSGDFCEISLYRRGGWRVYCIYISKNSSTWRPLISYLVYASFPTRHCNLCYLSVAL
jgi:hypothetical protein